MIRYDTLYCELADTMLQAFLNGGELGAQRRFETICYDYAGAMDRDEYNELRAWVMAEYRDAQRALTDRPANAELPQ